MKALLLSLLIVISINANSQDNYGASWAGKVGLDIGIGINNFSMKNQEYTKYGVDLGLIVSVNNGLWLYGMDFYFSPKQETEDTGVDGSRSTHVEYDASSFCWENYVGYQVSKKIVLTAGLGFCFLKEFDIMKGYSNLTAYEVDKATKVAPVLGLLYDISSNSSDMFYLKYDVALIGYKRHSFSFGVRF